MLYVGRTRWRCALTATSGRMSTSSAACWSFSSASFQSRSSQMVSHPVLSLCRFFKILHIVMLSLDYSNAMLAGLPASQLHRLQSVISATARLIRRSSRYEHVAPMLWDLYWLRCLERISFKLAALIYQCLHGLAVLHALLPPLSAASQRYNLRQRPHSLQLPEHTTQLSDCNFLIRLLYKNTYWLLFLCMFSHWCWPALCHAY